MTLTRRDLLLDGIAAGTALCLDLKSLFAANSVAPTLRALANDPRRPQFHLLPPRNWINDPNGPIFWNGKYHLFYQTNPACACFGAMMWGHAVSPDMLHWKHMPLALAPTPGGPDAQGCWSGTAVVLDGVVHGMYTGVSSTRTGLDTASMNGVPLREQQCLAHSTDPDLKTWTKQPTAVIDAPPIAGVHLNGFRDPSPWRHGENFYLIVGTGMAQKGGAIFLYRSQDLLHWQYQHIAASGDDPVFRKVNPVEPGDMWECPDLFPLGDKHVLLCSTKGKAHWQTGVLDQTTMRFHCEQTGILDLGAYYAPKTQLDQHGNRILWGWVQERRPDAAFKQAGWAGMISLPRVLTLDSNGRLAINVAPVVDTLRRNQQSVAITPDENKNRRHIAGLSLENCCGEILCTLPTNAGPFSLSIFGETAQGQPAPDWMTLRFAPDARDHVKVDNQMVPLDLGHSDQLEIHMYVDGSVAEIFLNRQAAYTKRFYYHGSQAPKVRVRIDGNTAKLRNLSLWQIAPISPDRLTT